MNIFTSWVSVESASIDTVNSSFEFTSKGEVIEISSAETKLIAVRMVMNKTAFLVKDIKCVNIVVPD